MTAGGIAAGDYLRLWRKRRRMSQLDFALEAEISQRERNATLLAAGFAPLYPERSLDDPAMASARAAVEAVLKGLGPYPALAVDRHWHLVATNRAVAPLLTGMAEDLLAPPVNALRLSLHPQGLAPRIANREE